MADLLLNEAKVAVHEGQEVVQNAAIVCTTSQSVAIHPLLTSQSVGKLPRLPSIATHDSTPTKQHDLGGTLRDPDRPAGAQNGASEASSCLDAGEWLFEVIGVLVASGRPRDAAPLPENLRGETRRQGGSEMHRRGGSPPRQRGRINSSAADHPFTRWSPSNRHWMLLGSDLLQWRASWGLSDGYDGDQPACHHDSGLTGVSFARLAPDAPSPTNTAPVMASIANPSGPYQGEANGNIR